jgi:hypothetical protein
MKVTEIYGKTERMLKRNLLPGLLALTLLAQAEPEKLMHLSFDKEGDFTDRCGNVKVITGAAKPEWRADGADGGGLYFDGKTTIRIAKTPLFSFGPDQSFSVELCFYPEKTKEKQWGGLMNVPAGSKFWSLSASGEIGRPMFNGAGGGKKRVRLLVPYQSMLKKWSRVAVVRDAQSKRISLYLDGKMLREADDTLAEMFAAKHGDIVIGRNFKGMIDEIILWKGAKRNFTAAKKFKARIEPLPVSPEVAESWKLLDENRLNLVPAPKRLKITGKPFKFDPAEWHVTRLNPADGPGFDIFADKLARITQAKFGKSGKKTIRAGLYDEMLPELKKANAPAKPIRQGYVLIANENSILIAGSDVPGLLYGWQTLADLIRENGMMTPATISDWPDFASRRLETGVASITGKNGTKILDSFFRQRANKITLTGQNSFQRTKAYPAAVWRKINAYAEARGMRISAVEKTSIIKIADFKKQIPPGYSTHYYPYKPEEGLFGYFDGGYSWSRDDLAEKKGRELGEYMAATGFSSISFHSVDCGSFDNPGNWAKRTEMDRKRWGEDRVGAEVNLITIFQREIRKKKPGANVGFCQYPYWCVNDPRMLKYYDDLAARLPKDIPLVLREGPREMFLDNARRLGSHSVGTSIYPYDYSFLPSYTNSGRYAGSMYLNERGGTGFVHWSIATVFNSASDMAASEYMWNAFAPGAALLPDGKHAYEIVFARCPEMEERLLPRIGRRIYGEKAGDTVAAVYALKLCARIPEHPDNILPADIDREKFFVKMQADAAESWKRLDAVRKTVPEKELPAYDELMAYVKRCELLAAARLHCLRARTELNKGNVEAGKAEAAKGLALTKDRRIRSGRMAHWKQIAADLNITSVIETRLRRAEYLKTINPVKVRVGLYGYRGSEGYRDNNAGILDGFTNVAGVSTSVVRIPTKDNLKKIDVLVFNATKQIGDCEEDPVENIKEFVRNGGSVIFAHNAVGRHNGPFKPTWFPDICGGFDATGTNQPVLTATDPDAVAGFLKKGGKYKHRYYDHCRLVPGPKGRIELKDNSGCPVLISGKVGKGRVVYTGEIFGLTKDGRLLEPELDEWKMLLNLFRWCAGKQ